MRAFFVSCLTALLLTASAAIAKADDLVLTEPRGLPPIAFERADGTAGTLDDYEGKIVVLNFWATWCAPCKVEMPTLARLQAALGDDVEVLALAVERTPLDELRTALDDLEAPNLDLLRDPSMASLRAIGAAGIPVTLVIDRDGREVYRQLGDAEWDDPAVIERLRTFAAGETKV